MQNETLYSDILTFIIDGDALPPYDKTYDGQVNSLVFPRSYVDLAFDENAATVHKTAVDSIKHDNLNLQIHAWLL